MKEKIFLAIMIIFLSCGISFADEEGGVIPPAPTDNSGSAPDANVPAPDPHGGHSPVAPDGSTGKINLQQLQAYAGMGLVYFRRVTEAFQPIQIPYPKPPKKDKDEPKEGEEGISFKEAKAKIDAANQKLSETKTKMRELHEQVSKYKAMVDAAVEQSKTAIKEKNLEGAGQIKSKVNKDLIDAAKGFTESAEKLQLVYKEIEETMKELDSMGKFAPEMGPLKTVTEEMKKVELRLKTSAKVIDAFAKASNSSAGEFLRLVRGGDIPGVDIATGPGIIGSGTGDMLAPPGDEITLPAPGTPGGPGTPRTPGGPGHGVGGGRPGHGGSGDGVVMNPPGGRRGGGRGGGKGRGEEGGVGGGGGGDDPGGGGGGKPTQPTKKPPEGKINEVQQKTLATFQERLSDWSADEKTAKSIQETGGKLKILKDGGKGKRDGTLVFALTPRVSEGKTEKDPSQPSPIAEKVDFKGTKSPPFDVPVKLGDSTVYIKPGDIEKLGKLKLPDKMAPERGYDFQVGLLDSEPTKVTK